MKTFLLATMSCLLFLPAPAKAGGAFTDLDKARHFTRDRYFDLVHTRIEVEVDIDAGRVFGSTTILFDGIVDGRSSVLLDAVDMRIGKVTTPDGRQLKFDYDGRVLAVDLGREVARRQRTGVVVTYSATPKSGLHFVRPNKDRPHVRSQAWTQGEDEYTRYWTPCYDFPDDMGTTETLITVKKGLKVLSNGKLLGKQDKGDREQWHWSQTKPHVTYLIMLAIGPWTVEKRQWKGIEVSFWSVDEKKDWVDRTFLPTIEVLDFFSEKVGLTYPWHKYAQIAVTDFFWGGMENTSATVLTRDTLHDERAEPDYSSQGLVAHELAHQWFGDLLTCRGWAEIWLNEGFATYFSALFREHKQGWESFIGQMYRARGWLDGELKRYKRPLVTHAYDHPGDMFDGHSYTKGAWVLHALRGWINNDDQWWAGIRAWVKRHKHKVVETSQLRRSFEKTTGLSLGLFFRQWVHMAGLPSLEVTTSWDRDTKMLTLGVKQMQKTDRWVPIFKLPLDVRIITPGKKPFERRFWIDRQSTDLVIPLESRPTFVEVDPKGWTPGTIKIAWNKKAALAALEDGSTAVTRFRAARRLAKWVGDDDVAAALTAQALDEGEWVGSEAAKTLGKLNSPVALEGLLSLTEHKASRVRAQVAESLVHYAPDQRIKKVAKALLKDRSYRVVASTARNYWRYKVGKRTKDLKRLTKSYSPWHVVASAAFASIARMDGKAALKLLKRYLDPSIDRRLREGAYRALGRVGEHQSSLQTQALELAELGLKDPQPNVRRGAIDAFDVAGRSDKAGLLLTMAERESHRRTRRRAEAAARALRAKARDPVGDLRDRLTDVEKGKSALERRIKLLETRLQSQRDRPHDAP